MERTLENDSAQLYVELEGVFYCECDCKRGFDSFSAANEYRLELQRGHLGHCGYVWLVTPEGTHFNLTRMTQEKRNKMLNYYNIPE